MKRSLSPQLIAKLSKLIFNGFDNSEIGLLVNLPENTIRAIRAGNAYPEVKKASLNLKNAAIERIQKSRGRYQGLCWFLERRFPRQFAKAEVQIGLAAGAVTNNVLVVSAEVAAGLTNRSKAVSDEINQLIEDRQPAAAEE